jgi:hypothetical protein
MTKFVLSFHNYPYKEDTKSLPSIFRHRRIRLSRETGIKTWQKRIVLELTRIFMSIFNS